MHYPAVPHSIEGPPPPEVGSRVCHRARLLAADFLKPHLYEARALEMYVTGTHNNVTGTRKDTFKECYVKTYAKS